MEMQWKPQSKRPRSRQRLKFRFHLSYLKHSLENSKKLESFSCLHKESGDVNISWAKVKTKRMKVMCQDVGKGTVKVIAALEHHILEMWFPLGI